MVDDPIPPKPTRRATRQRLTRAIVEGTPAPAPGRSRVVLRDDVVRGLVCRISAGGSRIYYAVYRAIGSGGKSCKQWVRLGEHGAITVDQARLAAREILGRVAGGTDVAAERREARNRPTLADFWPRYLTDTRGRWKPRTIEYNEGLWRMWIAPGLGAHYLDVLSREDITRWHRALAQHPTTANRALSLLRAVLYRAIEWGALDAANPAARVRGFQERSRERYLTPDEIRALWQAIADEEALGAEALRSVERVGVGRAGRGGPGRRERHSRGISTHVAALFRLLILTGARAGEIQAARWEWVDWEAGALRLSDSKTGAKPVWLSSAALDELRRLRALETPPTSQGPIISGIVEGAALINRAKPWDRIRRRAAALLYPDGSRPDALDDLRVHDLRHSFASLAVGVGVSLPVIGRALGHSEGRTTERYAHVADNPVRAAAEAVGKVIADAVAERQDKAQPQNKNEQK